MLLKKKLQSNLKKEKILIKFVKDIDLTLTVGSDYDGTKSKFKFEKWVTYSPYR